MQRDKNIIKFMENNHCGLTIQQTYRMFYKDCRYGNDMARKRLKKLYQMSMLKYHTDNASGQRVYILPEGKRMTPHDVLLIEFYSHLVFNGATVLEFRKEPKYTMGDKIIQPDGFIKFQFNGLIRAAILEVDFSHGTLLNKFLPFYGNEYWIDLYGGDPFIIVITENPKDYNIDLFEVVYLNFKMLHFNEKVLAI